MFGKNFFHYRSIVVLIFCLVLLFNFGSSPIRSVHAGLTNRPTYPPLTWYALPGKGLNGYVRALAVSEDNVYVGGEFNATGDGTTLTNLGNIARFDIKTQTWHALPNKGLNGAVYALAASGDDLYVGGNFSKTGDGITWSKLGNIARYNSDDNSWHPLPEGGLNGKVYTLAVSGNDLYVGGDFGYTGGISLTKLSNIARYDMSSPGWYSLPDQATQGLNASVRALAVSGSNLFVGGTFTQTDGSTPTSLGRIARYDTSTSTWYPLSSGGLDSIVRTLVQSGGDLYVGGGFSKTVDDSTINMGCIARYKINDEEWEALPNAGLNSDVNALEVSADDLYVGGLFNNLGDGSETDANRIARYNSISNTWYPLPEKGLTHYVYTLVTSGDDFFVGGSFPSTNGTRFVHVLNYIARVALDTPQFNRYLPLLFKR